MKFTQLRISNVKWRNILFAIGLVLVAFGLFYFYNYVNNNNRKEGFDTGAATRAYNARMAIIDAEKNDVKNQVTDPVTKFVTNPVVDHVQMENEMSKLIYNQLDIETLNYFTKSSPNLSLAETALKNRTADILDISGNIERFSNVENQLNEYYRETVFDINSLPPTERIKYRELLSEYDYTKDIFHSTPPDTSIRLLTVGYDISGTPSLTNRTDLGITLPITTFYKMRTDLNPDLRPYYKIGLSVLSNLIEDLNGRPIKSPYLDPALAGQLIDLKPAVDELNSRITGIPSTTTIPDMFKSMSLTDLKIKVNFYNLDNPGSSSSASPIGETSGPSPDYIGSLFGPASSNTLSTDAGSPMGETSVSLSGGVDTYVSDVSPSDSPFILSTDDGYDSSPLYQPNPAILSLPKQISTKKSKPSQPKRAQSNYKTSMTPHVKNIDDKSSQQISEILKMANENKKYFNQFISNITKKCEHYPHACADIFSKSTLQQLSDNNDKLKKIDIPKAASALKQNGK
jgi:hypothetical protein